MISMAISGFFMFGVFVVLFFPFFFNEQSYQKELFKKHL